MKKKKRGQWGGWMEEGRGGRDGQEMLLLLEGVAESTAETIA